MLTIKKIFCATDFSDASLKGLEYAADLAVLFKSQLTVGYVLPILPVSATDPNLSFAVPEYERAVHVDAEKQLKGVISKHVPKTVKARSWIGHGNAAHEIVRYAEEEKMDLIVIATHGHTGFHHFVVGSVAEKVIRLAHCPVLAIREPRK